MTDILAPLPEHAARFQRAVIILWSLGPGEGQSPWLKSMSALFSEAHCLLIEPTEGSFLVFFSPVCNYCCWLATLQYVHFPSTSNVFLVLSASHCTLIAWSYALCKNKWRHCVIGSTQSWVSLQFCHCRSHTVLFGKDWLMKPRQTRGHFWIVHVLHMLMC